MVLLPLDLETDRRYQKEGDQKGANRDADEDDEASTGLCVEGALALAQVVLGRLFVEGVYHVDEVLKHEVDLLLQLNDAVLSAILWKLVLHFD